jgi:superfamily II DNA helicase RecQ
VSALWSCPFILLSATMDEEGLKDVCKVLRIDRQEVVVLWKNSNRPNIFLQSRVLKRAIDVR